MHQIDQEFFEHFQQMRQRHLMRLTKLFLLKLMARAEEMLAAEGFPEFNAQHFGFLANLDLNGTTSTELAAKICVSKQAISKKTKEMERLGLIKFHPHEADGRAAVIRLTARGEELMRKGLEASRVIKGELVDQVGSRAIEQMIDTLKILVDGPVAKKK